MANINSATINVNLVPGSINVGLDPKVIKGTATVPARVKGLKGDKGDSGVWTGTDTPPEGYNVWIDPSGEEQSIVNSVNDKTGHVKLGADDVGALDASELLTNSDILAIWNQFYKGE